MRHVFLVLVFLGPPGIPGSFSEVPGAVAGELSQNENDVATNWEGRESGLAQPFTGIIGNKKEWKDLWEKAFRKKAPSVDFKRYAVACVFLGHYPGWWYSISLPQHSVSDSTVIVPYELVDLIVELRGDGNTLIREYGCRGQYKMRVVEKKPGFHMRAELVGRPQIPLKSDFKEILEKDRIGVPND